LHDLVRLTKFAPHDAHRVLYRNLLDWRFGKPDEKCYSLLTLFLPARESLSILRLEPFIAGERQISARGVGNHQIPPLIQDSKNITLDMLSIPFARQKIARPGIVSFGCKGIPDNP
jgi:hypothetical protein